MFLRGIVRRELICRLRLGSWAKHKASADSHPPWVECSAVNQAPGDPVYHLLTWITGKKSTRMHPVTTLRIQFAQRVEWKKSSRNLLDVWDWMDVKIEMQKRRRKEEKKFSYGTSFLAVGSYKNRKFSFR